MVSYDLETKTPCKINLFVSTNGGTTWQGPLIKVTGDVGTKIATGSHNITWNVLEEFDELRGDKIQFQVRADRGTIETVVIGTQEWTVKNLNVSRYRNGDIIPEVKDPREWENLATGAWCYYNNDPKNGAIYGKLYNWYAVNDPRGLAPKGFHIPTETELEMVKDLNDSNGFAGLLGGCRNPNGSFSDIYAVDTLGYEGSWWCSSLIRYTLKFINPLQVHKYIQSWTRFNSLGYYGFSVRCIKD
jgi:hypothetical protein